MVNLKLVILGSAGVCKQMDTLIKSQLDSISIDTFTNIEDFVENTNIRTAKYDRMLFISNVIPKGLSRDQKQQRLYGLLEYINSKLPEMRIISMCRDADDYDTYRFVFSAPIYANLNISKGLSAHLIIASVENDVSELKAQYEGKDDLGVQVIQQSVKKEKEVEQQPVKQEKKPSIFSRIFGGGKKNKKVEPKVESEQVSESQDVESTEEEPEDMETIGNDVVTEYKASDDVDEILSDIESESDVVSSSMSDEAYNRSKRKATEARKHVDKARVEDVKPVGVRYEPTKSKSQITESAYGRSYQPIAHEDDNDDSFAPFIPQSTNVRTPVNSSHSNGTNPTNLDFVPPTDDGNNYTGLQGQSAQGQSAQGQSVQGQSAQRFNPSTIPMNFDFTPSSSNKPVKTGVEFQQGVVPKQEEVKLPSTPSKPARKYSTDSLDELDFSLDSVKSSNVTIDDAEVTKRKVGVSFQDNRKDEDVMPVVSPIARPTVLNKPKANVDKHKFNTEEPAKKFNIDKSGNQDGVTGVRFTQGLNNDTDEDDFDASFVKKSYSRKPSTFGDISSLPSFEDITLNNDTEVEELGDEDTINITSDDSVLLNPTMVGGSPQVVEKIVERVVEKPVEKIVERVVEKPVEKIVEKEVVKEKTVYVAGGSSQAHSLKDILNSTEPIYLLVTGDRRSSITTTALSLANIFGGQMRTLYVDFDTDTRGSLVRLGIQNIVDEPDSIQNGIQNFRTPKVLDNIVYWGNNRFASLISTFGTDVSEAELTRAANALAVQQSFNLVVIDCPITKLGLLDDLLPICDTIVCVDGSVQSIMNTMSIFSELAESGVNRKVQNMMYRSSRLIATEKGISVKEFEQNRTFVNDIFRLSDEPIPWIKTPLMGTLDNIVQAVKNM